jgi:putative transposase
MANDPSLLRTEGAEERWRLALERQPELRSLIEAPHRSRADVQAAAARLGLHPSTLYRLLRRFAVEQTAEAITGEARGWRPGRSRLPSSIEAVIDAAIEDFYLTRQSPSLAALHREIELRCRAEGLAAPAMSTLRRRARKLSRKAVAGRREGTGAAEAQTMRPGALLVDRPNALWQIDHSPADVVIVDVETRTPIGRPWVTLVIDVASRVIAGLHVSLEDPSVISVGMALRHAILDKADALREREVAADWPGFGLPDGIHSDNGSDFRSATFRRACANLGIETDYRPLGAPRYGGHIERLIGTAQQEMHLLPGTTFSNVAERGDYDSDGSAALTLDELETWLWRFIAADYNVRVHSATGRPPLTAWSLGANGQNFVPRTPSDPERLAYEFLPSVSRAITRQGVVFNRIHYYEPFLEPLFDTGDRKLVVRFDPRDLSRIYVRTAQGVQTIRYRNLARPPMSLWELQAARRRLAAEGAANVNEEALFEARRRNAELVAGAKAETRRRRRNTERRDRGYAAAMVIDPPRPEPESAEQTGAISGRIGEIEQW